VPKLKLVFFGTPDFSVPSLDLLANHPLVDLQLVVSMPDRPAGRGNTLKSPEVIEYAKNNKINFHQSSNINTDDTFKELVKDADAFIVLAFAQFLKDDILSIPKLGCFNIHTSLLPKYRGAAPIHYALLNGDKSTGVSIQKMVKKMDAGDLCLSHSVDIHPNETGGLLYTRLKYQAALSLNDFVIKLSNNDLKFTKQDETNVSFAPTLKREDGFLDFKNMDFETLNNKVHALFPWPGTYCMNGKKRVKVFKIEKAMDSVPPGKTHISNKTLIVGAKDCSIRVIELQLEGKKRTTDKELINGLKDDFIIN
jgi:methionyl-tRNA formyltransferase